MTEYTEAVALAPVRGRDRIDVLDVLRGIAILGIFFMNIPFMGGIARRRDDDVRLHGLDAGRSMGRWSIIEVVAEGTQRGTLEMLFGAGMMILTARAMEPTGPVAVADLYCARTLWLLLLRAGGRVPAAVAGRHPPHLRAGRAVPVPVPADGAQGAGDAGAAVGQLHAGGAASANTSSARAVVTYVEAAEAGERRASPVDAGAEEGGCHLEPEADKRRLHDKERKDIAAEADRAARRAMSAMRPGWIPPMEGIRCRHDHLQRDRGASRTMLIGIALYKWGVIQGLKGAALLPDRNDCAPMGFGHKRAGDRRARDDHVRARPPKTIWATEEFAAPCRHARPHHGGGNYLLKTGVGRAVLHPFKAAGRTAFSLYVLETIIGMWILFPGFGLGLWNHFGWFGLAMVAALAVQAGLLVVANIWVRYFTNGPLEWASAEFGLLADPAVSSAWTAEAGGDRAVRFSIRSFRLGGRQRR